MVNPLKLPVKLPVLLPLKFPLKLPECFPLKLPVKLPVKIPFNVFADPEKLPVYDPVTSDKNVTISPNVLFREYKSLDDPDSIVKIKSLAVNVLYLTRSLTFTCCIKLQVVDIITSRRKF